MIDFSNVTNITLGGTEVTQIEDSLGTVLWTSVQPDYFYVEDRSGSDNTLTVMKDRSGAPTLTVYTSTDLSTWRSNGTTSTSPYVTFTIPANSKLYVKCTADTWASSTSAYNKMYASGNFAVGGNIMSLLYGDDFENETTLEYNFTFNNLFYNASTLVDASELELSATSLSENCYRNMFKGCSGLTTSPELPATTLAYRCYSGMFSGCTSLTVVSDLPPATRVAAQECYSWMFENCTSLTQAPATLPATTLELDCYMNMFKGCTALTTPPTLPATTLAYRCYGGIFSGCTSLTTAPELPATTLTSYCYQYMFSGCTSLSSVTTYATDISASGCLTNWLNNVAASGDFYNLGGASYTTDDPSGIPSGWTEHKTTFYVEDRSGSANTLNIVKSTSSAPDVTVYTSTDLTTWTELGTTSTTALTATIPANSRLYLKATANQWATSTSDYNNISASGNFAVGGNIMSLLYGDNYDGQVILEYNNAFCRLLSNANTLKTANTLSLPATTLSVECYESMFANCTSLTKIPELPATTLATYCYYQMFSGCTALTTAPELPATTLTDYCYYQMFYGCSSLNKVTVYTTDNSATDCITNWLYGVAATGDFYNTKDIQFTSGPSGIPTGWTEHKSYFYVEDRSGAANMLSIVKGGSSAPDVTVYTSSDKENWTELGTTSTTALTATIPANGKLYLKATANQWGSSSTQFNTISASGNFAVGGNIMSLLYGDNYNKYYLSYTYTFAGLFNGVSTLVDASDLELPATTLKNSCYNKMFRLCSNLTSAPVLPAKTLQQNCYGEMFYGCRALTTAPELPATTLATSCYSQMFNSCSALTTAPALPVTTLINYCYYYMFSGCTSLTTAPELPATTLINYCYQYMFSGCTSLSSVTTYATDISAFGCLTNWLNNVAASGDFYNLGGASYTTDDPSGIPTGWIEHTSI